MKRWLRRILIAVAILIVVVIVATQLVLWSDYPRTLVLGLVQRELGLRVEATSLSTGWLGSSTLTDVKASLPLAQESFLIMPTMEVDHTALIPLLLTRKFELDSITLNKPNLVVRRGADGRWNLQDVAELLAKAGGGTPEPGTKQRPPKLPRLRLREGTITVLERDGGKAVIEPLTVRGDPTGALVYKYEAKVPGELEATGQVAPGENWKHEVTLSRFEPAAWLAPWMKTPPQPLMAAGRWTGSVERGRVSGRLMIEQARYEQFGASGEVMVSAGGDGGAGDAGAASSDAGNPRGGTVTISPRDLLLTTGLAAAPKVQLASGAVRIDGEMIRAQQVRISTLGGTAQLDGSGNLAAKSADATLMWVELPAPGEIRHSGSLTAVLRTPFPGGPEINATLRTRGAAPSARWDGEVRISGAGRSWTDMSWAVSVQRLDAEARRWPLAVRDLTLRVEHRGDVATLQSVEWPGHTLTGSGRYDHSARRWSFDLSGRTTTVATSRTDSVPLEFDLDLSGEEQVVRLNRLTLAAQEMQASASGAYDARLPKPVDLRFDMAHFPRPPQGTDRPPLRGRLMAEGVITGTLKPVELGVVGALRTRDLIILGRQYGDIRGQINGAVTASAARFAVRDLKLLGGQWQVDAVWPYQGPDRMVTAPDPLRARIVAVNLDLEEVGDLLGAPLEGPDAQGDWTLEVPFPRPRRDTIAMTGTFRTGGLSLGDGAFHADEVVGKMSLHNGTFHADPITLRRSERNVNGTATVTARLDLDQPMRPDVVITAQTWPIPLGADAGDADAGDAGGSGGAIAAVTADARLAIDARDKTATGPFSTRAAFATTQRAIGEAAVRGEMDGRVARLTEISVDAAGGRAEGIGTIDTLRPNRSRLTLAWSGVQGERLVDLIPQLRGLSGRFGGALELAPAVEARALEPLRFTLALDPESARYNALELGPMRFSAFADLRDNFAPQRIVLDELPEEIRRTQQLEKQLDADNVPIAYRPLAWNDIRLADGRIRIWARRGRHELADAAQTHLILSFTRLDLDQLVHAVKPDAQPMPGRLSGSLTVHGNMNNRDLLFGRGQVQITESDLGNVDALALLYNATSGLGQPTTRPTGSGSLDLSLQASALSLQNIRYFNRGVQARSSSIDLSNIWAGTRAKIFGFIIGSARPLKDLDLPILADMDQILEAVHGDPTVRIEGTIGDPQVRLVPFEEAGEAFKRFIVGEVNTERRE